MLISLHITHSSAGGMSCLGDIIPGLNDALNVELAQNKYVEEYIIPEDQKEAVLALLYPFTNVPSLNKVMIDIHEDKKFRVRDYKVIQGPDRPFLMSPYWETSGGSVIDWFPARHG